MWHPLLFLFFFLERENMLWGIFAALSSMLIDRAWRCYPIQVVNNFRDCFCMNSMILNCILLFIRCWWSACETHLPLDPWVQIRLDSRSIYLFIFFAINELTSIFVLYHYASGRMCTSKTYRKKFLEWKNNFYRMNELPSSLLGSSDELFL